MSEDKSRDTSPSGTKPGVSTPTMIGEVVIPPKIVESGTTIQPTTIGTPISPNAAAIKPTIIEVRVTTRERPVIHNGPTNIQPPPPSPVPAVPVSRIDSATTSPAPKNVTPTLIPGTTRKPLEVASAELERAYLGTPPEILCLTCEILNKVFVETLTISQCSLWGVTAQKAYSDSVNASLELSSDKTFLDCSRHLSRLFSIISEIAASFEDKGHGLAFWKKKCTPAEELADHSGEINQIRSILERALPKLDGIREKLELITREIEKSVRHIHAEALAAQYLADKLNSSDQQKSHILQTQSISLMKTVALVQEGIALRNVTISQIEALSNKIRESVLVTLPAWMERVSFTFNNSPTDTDLFNLRSGIGDLLIQLK